MSWEERYSLRTRIALFFGLIAAVSVALLVAAIIWLSVRLGATAADHIVLIVGSAAFAIAGLVVWVALKFDEHLAKPLTTLAADLKTMAHTDGRGFFGDGQGRYLGMLAPAARDVSMALAEARARTNEAIDAATADAARQKQTLEQLLRDLNQGLVICTLAGRVTLYNRRAVEILHVEEFRRNDPNSTDVMIGSLGLGRDFFNIVDDRPFREAIAAFDAEAGASRIVFSTCDGAVTMRGHLAPRLDETTGEPVGFVAVFDDITAELAAGLERDRVLRDAICELKSVAVSDQAAPLRQQMEPAVRRLQQASNNIIATAWPMADIPARRLFAAVRSGVEHRPVTLTTSGDTVLIHADSATLIALLRHLAGALMRDGSPSTLHIEANGAGHERQIILHGQGKSPTPQWLETVLDENADPDTAFLSGRSILERHRATAECRNDRIVLTFPVNTVAELATAAPALAPGDARPEFYDFDLFGREPQMDVLATPLSQLHCVVFDCEMTGLDPRRGDEIVSIAGARVVNGRVLTGEVFDLLVNPGRRIPAASTNIHHITDAMVANAPGVSAALKRFHAFAHDQVLVAHNAAFDMAFLAKGQAAARVQFDNVVLDTVLLAASLQGVDSDLTLDALAARFGITIAEQDRHTARGDALATAHVFANLVRLLEASGVQTLGDALRVSEAQTAIRRRQKAYA